MFDFLVHDSFGYTFLNLDVDLKRHRNKLKEKEVINSSLLFWSN